MSGLSPAEAQRGMMDDSIHRGIANPAKSVNQRSHREHLVKAIIQDDLAFRLTENEGMFELLTHILPAKLKALVSQQTVARDLKVLYKVLDERLETTLKVRVTVSCSRFANIVCGRPIAQNSASLPI